MFKYKEDDASGALTGGTVYFPAQPPKESPPTWIALAHELVHAWRFATLPGTITLKGAMVGDHDCPMDEALTVGLGYWIHNYTYNENRIRLEYGMSQRLTYE